MKYKRQELTESCQRATPDQWTQFITASRVIKIMCDREPTILFNQLTNCYFEQRRYPGIGYFYDSSRTKKGRQSIPNRLAFMRSISYPWNFPEKPMSNDLIRIEMKHTFFPYLKHRLKQSSHDPDLTNCWDWPDINMDNSFIPWFWSCTYHIYLLYIDTARWIHLWVFSTGWGTMFSCKIPVFPT
jgi:hypothetical protein